MPDHFNAFLAANDDGASDHVEQREAAFVVRVRAALKVVGALAGGTGPKSIAAFTKNYSISRSALYKDYKYLLPEILSVLRKNKVVRKNSVALEKSIAAVRREAKTAVAKALATSYDYYLAESGPLFQDKSAIGLRCQALEKKDHESERIINNQNNIILSLTRQVNELMSQSTKMAKLIPREST